MADEAIRNLVSQGLAALKAGSKIAADATSEIQNDAKHPDLKAALQQGNETSKKWQERIQRAFDQAGGAGEQDDPIMQAHYDVSRKIRQRAEDDQARDLGIIAAGQLALHYWIASFGTLKTYASRTGMGQVEQDMQSSLDEAKQADQMHTQLAQKIMQG